MSNVFRGASNKIRDGGLIIPITLVFIAMFFVSCALMYEDYSTSLAGYQALPTRKVNDWVIPLVALLPQLGQVGFTYVFATDTNRQWAFAVAFLLWAVDVFTDVYYKALGLGASWYVGATVETITIYSIGSELMMATSIGILADLLGPFFRVISRGLGTAFNKGSHRQDTGFNKHNLPKGNQVSQYSAARFPGNEREGHQMHR